MKQKIKMDVCVCESEMNMKLIKNAGGHKKNADSEKERKRNKS